MSSLPNAPPHTVLPVPRLGLGTWQLSGAACERSVEAALEIGYRHIDTAERYRNEAAIGRAMRRSGVERREVFLTSKVWWETLRHDEVLEACRRSLERLGTDSIDLYLMHWPNPTIPMAETIGALEELREEGLIGAWGGSNFAIHHLEEARRHGRPALDQVELHPRLRQAALTRYCHEHGIVVTAYSPLAQGRRIDGDSLAALGRRYGKSAEQVALRWSLQHGHVVIPRSRRRDHIVQNFDVFDFELTPSEMVTIDRLDRGERLIEPEWADFRD